MNQNKIGLAHQGTLYEMALQQGSLGPDALDISALYQDRNLFTYDPSFTSTASCKSRITYIDGDAGVLLYGGYPIEDLAERGNFLETAYLLLHAELPSSDALKSFSASIATRRTIPARALGFLQGFERDAHPMAILVGMVGALSAYHMSAAQVGDPQERLNAALNLIAKVPTVAAQAYRFSAGLPATEANGQTDLVSDFLRMCFEGQAHYRDNPVITRALDRIFVLHADHEQNVSTSTVRLAGSSDANPFSCIAAGIACLWGPAHGGANEAALNMLKEIGSVENIPRFIARAKNKDDPFRLMGFGHRIYKNYDPRARLMQQTCHEVLKELGRQDDPILQVALALEQHALSDSYFIDKKLYPNIDFYSGITLRAIGFPTTMFTVLFAVARTAGWIAQWKEMMEDPEQRIGRPRQIYIGSAQRPYSELNRR